MKLNKTLALVIIYIALKIASYIDFHNSTLNTFFANKYLRYLLLCVFLYKILELMVKIYKSFISQSSEFTFIDRATFSIKNGFIGYPERVGTSVAQEFSMFYYAFFGKKKKPVDQEFTYHVNNSAVGLYWAFIILTIVETGIIHYLFFVYDLHWLNAVLLLLNVYTIIFILGHIRAMRSKPMIIKNNSLLVNNGLFISEPIAINEIEKIYPYNEGLIKSHFKILKLGLVGKLEPINVVVEFKKEKTITLIYGLKRTTKVIAFYIDDYVNFSNTINLQLNALLSKE